MSESRVKVVKAVEDPSVVHVSHEELPSGSLTLKLHQLSVGELSRIEAQRASLNTNPSISDNGDELNLRLAYISVGFMKDFASVKFNVYEVKDLELVWALYETLNRFQRTFRISDEWMPSSREGQAEQA